MTSIVNRDSRSLAPAAADGAHPHHDFTALRRGFGSVTNKIAENLAELSRESADGQRGPAVAHNLHAPRCCGFLVHADDVFHQLAYVEHQRMLRVTLERKTLLRDACYPFHFAAGMRHEMLNRFEVVTRARQVKKIGQRFQWIVNLVRNGMRHLAGRRDFFRGAQGILGELAIGDIRQYQHLAGFIALGIHRFNGELNRSLPNRIFGPEPLRPALPESLAGA
jgi:hypothetical protein